MVLMLFLQEIIVRTSDDDDTHYSSTLQRDAQTVIVIVRSLALFTRRMGSL